MPPKMLASSSTQDILSNSFDFHKLGNSAVYIHSQKHRLAFILSKSTQLKAENNKRLKVFFYITYHIVISLLAWKICRHLNESFILEIPTYLRVLFTIVNSFLKALKFLWG